MKEKPARKEEDTLSEAGKRKAAGVADTMAAPPEQAPAPNTMRIERPRRRKKNAADNEQRPDDAPEATEVTDNPRQTPPQVEAAENPITTSTTPLTGTPIVIRGADSDPVPSALPMSERIPLSNPGRWDRYEILGLLGKGGMGSVFEARDKRINRHVALKFIHTVDPYMTSRFLQEARAQARMDHPNVCKVLEVGEVEGRAYIAMQLIRGEQLSKIAESISLDEKVRLMKTVTDAVSAAHRLQIIHRDIKPANIMVEKTELPNGSISLNPILMDFGLAREESGTQGLTESGALLGTPGYMSPEQARGHTRGTDARTDVYGLGATLYDLLTGAPPFVDANVMNVVLKVLIDDPVPLRVKNPDIPLALETIVLKCLAKEPHRRYASAAELSEDLERYLSREKVLARRLSLPEKLYWRGKRNKPMAFAILALVFTLGAFAVYGVDMAIENARREEMAQKRAELGKKLSGAVKDLDWLVRTAHLVPLHDTTKEKDIVRQRMAGIEAEMRSFADLGAGFDHFALGRGHLALEEWNEAREQLESARGRGILDAELDYGLGRALGELYHRALDDARRSGDATYFAKRKVELDKEYLEPALLHLEKCRGLPTVSASYLEGLIHFYHRRDKEALEQAALARQTTPWLYEAAKLEGDVYLAQALDAKDKGDNDNAEKDFDRAVEHYEQAAEIGRSDHQVYEALAEAWIRQEELDLYRGRDPKLKLDKALSAADKALKASPKESSGHTKKAFAYYFAAQYAQGHGAARKDVEELYRGQIDAGNAAITLNPKDAYAREITGVAYTRLAEHYQDRGESTGRLVNDAIVNIDAALQLNPGFPWALNDYGIALALEGIQKKRHNEDPSDFFERAIGKAKRAIQIDPGYVIAYNNMASWMTDLAEWKLNHGENPEALLRESVEMADTVLRTHNNHPFAHGNAGLAFAMISSYRLMRGEDGVDTAKRAISHFNALLEVDNTDVQAYRESARVYHLLASHEALRDVNPEQSLKEGFNRTEKCLRIIPTDARCKLVLAKLMLEQAKWKAKRGESASGLFDTALRTVVDASTQPLHRSDFWQSIAVVYLDIILELDKTAATSATTPRMQSEATVRGVEAISKALEIAPGLPYSLAISAALCLQKSRRDPSSRTHLEQAHSQFTKAIEGNANLKITFGKMADEVERELATR
jgi:serine/threonine-protein kinase